jgi:hypothetical protein
MKSAAAYTNQRRVLAEAGNLKVEQIGNIATNRGSLQPVLPSQASPLTPVSCGPNFTHYEYFKGCRTLKHTTCSTPGPAPPPVNTLNYTYVAGGGIGNPGSGNFRPALVSYPTILLQLSIIDADGDTVSSLLTAMASATSITFYKTTNPSVTTTSTVNTATNNGAYWTFNCTVTSTAGTPTNGDNITFTYS